MRTFLITASLLFTLLLRAQDAKEILGKSLQAVKNLEQASYHVSIVQTNLLTNDTNRYEADCWVKKMPRDSLTGMHYYFSTGNGGFCKYNGTAYYSYVPGYYDFVIRYSAKENPGKFRAAVVPGGITPPEVTSQVYFTFNLLRSGEEISSMIDEISAVGPKSGSVLSIIKDTLVDDVECYGFRITKPKKNFATHKLILVDRDNFLPLTMIRDFKSGNISIKNGTMALGQYSSVRYSKIKKSLPRFDYLMSEKSLPKKVEVADHLLLTEPFRIGDHAPALALPLAGTGRNISTDSLAGRVLVLNFTSSSCLHNAEGAAVIKELYTKYGERKDVIFINIFSSGADSREKVEKYYKEQSLEGFTFYYSTDIERTWGILGYPDFFLIDRHGRIAYFQRGYNGDLLYNMARQIDDCLGRL